MKNDITYHWGDDHLVIDLGNRIQTRIRILFWAEFLFTMGMATIFLLQSLPIAIGFLHWTASMCAATLYILASYRFLSRMYTSETIVLNRHSLVIIQKTLFARYTRHYDWRGMGPLHYAGKIEKTAHPLKGNGFDYFGFDTHEHLIQSLHHDGNLYFNYGGYPIHFARGVYSWHAEEMVNMMKLFTGPVLKLGPEWENMLQEYEA